MEGKAACPAVLEADRAVRNCSRVLHTSSHWPARVKLLRLGMLQGFGTFEAAP